jgi:hypothetical protein
VAHGQVPFESYASANRTNTGKRNTKAKFRLNFAIDFAYSSPIPSELLLSGYGRVTEKHQK